MRISSRAVVDHVRVNLQRNLAQLDRWQSRLSSGRRVQYPSDDPASASLAVRLRAALSENDQYRRNVDAGISWLQTTDTALQDVVQTLHRARELVIQGARGDLPPSARRALADEMDQLLRHLVEVGNTRHGARYIFGGARTDRAPLAISGSLPGTGWVQAVQYQGDATALQLQAGPEVTVPFGLAGPQVFGPLDPSLEPELFRQLRQMRDDLEAGAVDDLNGRDLQWLEQALDRVLDALAETGARQQGLELLSQRLQSDELNLKELLSRAEDLDVAEAITELKMQENVYRLALASAARVLQPTLMEFLR